MKAKEWIAAFDRGESIETISMGGMGDGYESAIQSCAIETLRRLYPHPVVEDKDENNKWVQLSSDEAVKILDSTHGFSGAQVGAAMNLAANVWRRGTESFADVPDRIIHIKQHPTDPKRVTIES